MSCADIQRLCPRFDELFLSLPTQPHQVSPRQDTAIDNTLSEPHPAVNNDAKLQAPLSNAPHEQNSPLQKWVWAFQSNLDTVVALAVKPQLFVPTHTHSDRWTGPDAPTPPHSTPSSVAFTASMKYLPLGTASELLLGRRLHLWKDVFEVRPTNHDCKYVLTSSNHVPARHLLRCVFCDAGDLGVTLCFSYDQCVRGVVEAFVGAVGHSDGIHFDAVAVSF